MKDSSICGLFQKKCQGDGRWGYARGGGPWMKLADSHGALTNLVEPPRDVCELRPSTVLVFHSSKTRLRRKFRVRAGLRHALSKGHGP